MVLQKLTLENFQGIRSLILDFPKGCSGNIYGDNATGKTTIFNSITYLLFDKASTGAKGFNPKTRDANGEVHGLDHSVTGEFILDTGEIVTLKKLFKETWKKRRGAAEKTLEGHTVEYSINGVPTKEKDYNNAIIGWLGDVEKAKILTMPDYFPEAMKWEDRRKILLEVCGDITDADVINSNAELKPLETMLLVPGSDSNTYSIEDYRKITAAKRKDINDRLDTIPARIDEAEKAIPTLSDETPDSIREKIALCEKQLEELQTQRTDLMSEDNRNAKIREQIAQTRAKCAEAKTAYIERENGKNSETRLLMAEKANVIEQANSEIMHTKFAIGEAENQLLQLEERRKHLLAEWDEISTTKWNPDSEICPTCGQKLPAEKIESMRSEFNLKRSQKLEALNKTGRSECSKDMIDFKKAHIEKLKKSLENRTTLLESEKAELEALKGQLVKVPPFEDTDEYRAFVDTMEKLIAGENEVEKVFNEATKEVDEQIAAKKAEIEVSRTELSGFTIAETQKARIAELEEEQRELSAAFDETERGLYLTDLFIKTKVAMLTEKINSKFKTVSFQLFVDQINGGVKEGCEVLVPGEGGRLVPYMLANNAARMNAGLEIVGTLSEHWGIKTPVIVDNAEANTHPLRINTQQIMLYVSESDKELRLETR